MFNFVFSLAIHEKLETAVDQIENILFFNKNSAIVIHLSSLFLPESSKLSLEEFKNYISRLHHSSVFINPTRLVTTKNSLLQVHLLNFKYAISNLNFSYFAIINSNDLFVKNGFFAFAQNFDCGVEIGEFSKKWMHFNFANQNKIVQTLVSKGIPLYISYLEGTFYSRDLFLKIEKFLSFFPIFETSFLFPCEEIVIPSLAKWFSQKFVRARAIQNGIGSLFVNHHTIQKCFNNKSKFAVKRIDRNFFDYQRSYIRINITKDNSLVSSITGLSTKNTNMVFYFFKDAYLSFKNILIFWIKVMYHFLF
jgi:hypothetical protein